LGSDRYVEHLTFSVLAEVDESQLDWPCYECVKCFRTSADLQKHLAVHDDDVGLPRENDDDGGKDPECMMSGTARRGYRRKRQVAAAGDDGPSAAGNDDDAAVVG